MDIKYTGLDEALTNVLDKEFLTTEEFEAIEDHEQLKYWENCGMSGLHPGYKWYSVAAKAKGEEIEEYDIYIK